MPNPEIDHVEIKGTTYDVAGSGGAVTSVNGQTGAVVLDADDVGALPDNTSIPSNTSDLNNDSGFITSSDIPVTSVNSKTGAVSLSASDVGALPSSTTIPTKVSDLQNDSGFITTETDPTVPSWAKASTKPSYTAQEVGALPSSTSIPSNTSDLNNDSGFITSSDIPVTSVNSQTGAVTLSIPDSTSDLQNDSGFVSSQQTEKIFVQGTTPSTASDGDIWIDTATQSASGIAYLPLSAGASHPLSGNLHIDSQATAESYLCMYANEAMRGQLYTQGSTGQYPSFYISAYNGSSQKATIVLNGNDGYMVLGANNESIILRPNGIYNTTNQVVVDANGQIIGGHSVVSSEKSTSTSCATNKGTALVTSISKPSWAKFGLQYGYVSFSRNAAGRVRVSVTGTSQDMYVPDTSGFLAHICGVTTSTAAFSLNPANGTATATYAKLDVIWF